MTDPVNTGGDEWRFDDLRAVDHNIATGVWPDMTTHGWPSDEWPRSEWDAGCRFDFENPEHR